MKVELDNPADTSSRVQAYRPGSIVIGGQHYSTSIILGPGQQVRDWPPQSFADIAAQHIELIAVLEPELIILGTGDRMRLPSAATLEPLLLSNIGYEIMDTGAACRSYNILLAEGRRVAAALLMIQ